MTEQTSKPAQQAARLGTDPLGPLLWRSASQTTLSVATYGVYALTNAWFVSWGVGATALAAVNLVTPVLLLLGTVATTVGVGGASLVSRALGSGKISDASRATGSAFVVFWSVAITVTVTGLVFTEPILDLLAGFGTTILAVVVNNQLMAGGGALALAAYAVGARIQTFMIMPQTGISQGMQPIVGYNHGLRKAARVTGALRLSIASTHRGLVPAGPNRG